MAKTSTIFIATETETRVYRSVRDVPPKLRRRLQETTNGMNSATILIADRRGRAELSRALQGEPSVLQSRLADAVQAKASKLWRKDVRNLPLRFWLEILLPVAAGLSLWLLISPHF